MARIDASSRQPTHSAGLRTHHLVVLLIAAHTPVTLLWTVVPIAFGLSGVVATPLIFALAGLILLGFVLGYSGLGRRIRHPGGLYVLVTRGLGRPIGLGAATVQLLGYLGVVSGLYGLTGRMLKQLVLDVFGVDLPMSLTVVFWAVAVLCLSQIPLRYAVRLLTVVVGVQLFTVLWFAFAAVGKPINGDVSFAALDPGWLLSGSFGIALVFAVTAFIGSEGGAAYSDELADPQRSIPLATYLSYAVTTVVLVVSAWAVTVVVGAEQAATPTGSFLPSVLAHMVNRDSMGAVVDFAMLNLCIGLLATSMTMNNATSRQIAGLARDGVLPASLAPKRAGAPPPAQATIVQPVVSGLIALAATFSVSASIPLWLAVTAGLGITGVLMLASASTAVWFLRGEADEGGFFGWEGQVIAGLLSVGSTGGVFFYGVMRIREVAPGAPPAAGWMVGSLIAVVFSAGMIWAFVLRANRPSAYAAIGGMAVNRNRPVPAPMPPAPVPANVPAWDDFYLRPER